MRAWQDRVEKNPGTRQFYSFSMHTKETTATKPDRLYSQDLVFNLLLALVAQTEVASLLTNLCAFSAHRDSLDRFPE